MCQYGQSSGEAILDSARIGVVMQKVTDTELTTHLMMTADRLSTEQKYRQEIVNISNARAATCWIVQHEERCAPTKWDEA